MPIICFTDSGMVKPHEQYPSPADPGTSLVYLLGRRPQIKKMYSNASKFQMSKITINRRLLVGKENIQQALCCTALCTTGHGQWDALMEPWKVSNLNFYVFFSTGHTGKLYEEYQLSWDFNIKREKKWTRESLPAGNKYYYKMFLQVRGKFKSSAASRSSCGTKVKIIMFESSEDKKQNFKNISTLGTGVPNASQY